MAWPLADADTADMTAPQHDPLLELFAPDARVARDALAVTPRSAFESDPAIDPMMLKVSAKVPVGWMPSWLLFVSTSFAVVLGALILFLARPFLHPVNEREPWLGPVVGGAIGMIVALTFGLIGLAIAVGAMLAFAGIGMAVAIGFLPLLEEDARRRGNPVARSVRGLAETTRNAIADYAQTHAEVVALLAWRRKQSLDDVDRSLLEAYWHDLRRAIIRQADALDGVCAVARDIEAEAATGPIIMGSAAVAEGFRALVAAGDADDIDRFAASPEIGAFKELVDELQKLEVIADEQAAFSHS